MVLRMYDGIPFRKSWVLQPSGPTVLNACPLDADVHIHRFLKIHFSPLEIEHAERIPT